VSKVKVITPTVDDSPDCFSSDLNLPRHIAIVMDGNGRWASLRKLPRVAGHKVGVESIRAIIKACSVKNAKINSTKTNEDRTRAVVNDVNNFNESNHKGIEVLTLFAFSVENWQRPSTEVNFLMELIFQMLTKEIQKLHKSNVQLRIIGNRDQLNSKLCKAIVGAEQLTANNTGLKLVIALNYSGRWDITQAVQKIGKQVAMGIMKPEDITKDFISPYFALADLPEPDFFIRTSGEMRISNFLLWQLAYTELYFTEVLWPDFREGEFEKALQNYASRERRFGKI